ncbi:MAG: HRDC domain-containing protein [Planctomycetota bacterium]
MPFELFQYHLPHCSDLSDLNQFLASHTIVSVQRQWVTDNRGTTLVMLVEYVGKEASASKKASRIDYRDVFDDADFQAFSQLRALRKQLAEREGVPVYTVFTNEQLAELVRRRVTTPAEMKQITGIGTSKCDKHWPVFQPALQSLFGGGSAEPDKLDDGNP